MQHRVLWVAQRVPLSIWTYFFSLDYNKLKFYVRFFVSASYFKVSSLEIRAVRARNKLSIGIVSWEPCFKIILFGSCIIKSSGNNINNLVGQLERSHKLFRSGNHFFMQCPRVFWLGQNKLLNLFELMNSENSPGVFTMGSCLLSETCGSSCVPDRKRLLLDPFLSMISRNRLFRSSN